MISKLSVFLRSRPTTVTTSLSRRAISRLYIGNLLVANNSNPWSTRNNVKSESKQELSTFPDIIPSSGVVRLLTVPYYVLSQKRNISTHDPVSRLNGDTIMLINYAAPSFAREGKYEIAAKYYESVLPELCQILGENHVSTIKVIKQIGEWYLVARKYDLTIQWMQELKRVLKNTSTSHDSHVQELAELTFTIATLYSMENNHTKALSTFEECLQFRTTLFGSTHAKTIEVVERLSVLYDGLGMKELSINCYEQMVRYQQETLGETHEKTLKTTGFLASLYLETNNHQNDAIQLYSYLWVTQCQLVGENHPNSLKAMYNLAKCYSTLQQYELSISVYEDCLKKHLEVYGRNHGLTNDVMYRLGQLYYEIDRYNDALLLFNNCYEFYKLHFNEVNEQMLILQHSIVLTLKALQRYNEAIVLIEDCLLKCVNTVGKDHQLYISSLEIYNELVKLINNSN